MTLDQQALETLGATDFDARARERRRRYRWGAAGAALVALAVAAGLLAYRPPVEVQVAPVEAPDKGGTAVLSASGYVVARRLATVSAKVTGRIDEVLIEEGATVAAGQVLARLDDRSARASDAVARRERDSAERALAETTVLLAEARRTRDRQRSLRVRELVSQAAVDAAEAEADALAARLATARAQLAVRRAALEVTAREVEDHVVRAPFAGVVISKDAQPGEMVSPISAGGGFTRTGIATIVDMDSREIEVDVNESFINRVQPGQRAQAVLDAYPDWTLPARVTAIVPAADRQKATVRVRIAFEQLDPRILPDMGVRVRFFEDAPAGRRVRALLPQAAVFTDAGRTQVWVLREGRVHRVTVTAGRELEGRREILEGVDPGATVVVGPPAGLADGARVRVGDGA